MTRVITGMLVAMIAVLVAAPTALAHVTANPAAQVAGSFTKLEFRVPNERDEPTTSVAIQIPEGIDFVSVQPVPEWTFEIKKAKLDKPVKAEDGDEVTDRVSEIVFTGKINPGEFQSFYIGMKLPDEGSHGDHVFFPTVQSYGDEDVSWIDTPAEGQDPHALEHPSPFVTLGTEADVGEAAGHDDAGDDSSPKTDAPDLDKYATDAHVHEHTQKLYALSIGALALSVIALLVVARRGRKRD